MTAHPLSLARAMHMQSQPQTGRHTLAKLDARIGRRTVVFMPTGDTIDRLLFVANGQIGSLAPPRAVHRVVSHNPDVLWGIASRHSYNASSPAAEGMVAFLMLNEKGLKRLADGSLDRTDPDLSLLAAQNERPAGIYTWAIFVPASLVGAIPLVYEKLCAPLYNGVSLYAWAATPDGKRFAETLGFTLGAPLKGAFASHLHYYPRGEALNAAAPAYDSYRKASGPAKATVTVARSFEDLMRVISIRSAVYMAEQDCPYEEEFDGNDLSATHLIGYIGDEPAGCLRLRYFAGFVKMERLAVRHEFRTSKLSFRLVRAGIDLARRKGYRRVYGHVREDLVRFWEVFGFRLIPGRPAFNFSGIMFLEMAGDLAPDPMALHFGDDPYTLVRPEGRWDTPGILECSATRDVRSFAKENRS